MSPAWAADVHVARGDAQGAVGLAVQGSITTMPQKSPAFRVATAASLARAMAAI